MSAGVEVEGIVHEKYNARKELDEFVSAKGIVVEVTARKWKHIKSLELPGLGFPG